MLMYALTHAHVYMATKSNPSVLHRISPETILNSPTVTVPERISDLKGPLAIKVDALKTPGANVKQVQFLTLL